MNLFDHANQQGMVWVKEMMQELRTQDPHKALRALRAGLQALRDRLTIDEAAQLSAQLPLIIRGIYFEGWDPTGKPLRIRHRSEFLDLVAEKYGPGADASGAVDTDTTSMVVALFRVLGRHVSTGEITDIVMTLPDELVELVTGRSCDLRSEDA